MYYNVYMCAVRLVISFCFEHALPAGSFRGNKFSMCAIPSAQYVPEIGAFDRRNDFYNLISGERSTDILGEKVLREEVVRRTVGGCAATHCHRQQTISAFGCAIDYT